MSQIVRIHVNDELSFLVETEDEELNIEDPHGELSLSLPPGAVPKGAIMDKIEDLKHTVTSVVSWYLYSSLQTKLIDEQFFELSVDIFCL